MVTAAMWLMRGLTQPVAIIDHDGWLITQGSTMCTPSADPRYYSPKVFALSDLLAIALGVCALLFCWHFWHISIASRGWRVLTLVVGILVALCIVPAACSAVVDITYGFIGFVPTCPPQ